MTITDIVIAVAVILFLGVYVSWRAGRLDRMHTRLEAARAALDVTLVRRSSVVLELAASGFLDPATSVLLADAAHEARGGQGTDLAGQQLAQMELTQSNLSRALRAAFAQPGFQDSLVDVDGAADLLAELEAAAHQVLVARKFYNTAVATTRDARRKPLVRLLRLAGHAPRPEFFEMDDSLAVEDDDGAGADMQRLSG
ncbi:MAG TPA: hypothetical protein VH089_01135 [Streptosporangiaceae bacterium]|jgi:hypothetical protein|nr:hypothetical protein [Streptosporangiaceae bacterium]